MQISGELVRALKNMLKDVCSDRKNVYHILGAFLIMGLGIAGNVSIPIMFKKIIDELSLDNSSAITYILISYGFIWLISQMSLHLRELLMYRVEQKTSFIMSSSVLSHLYSLGPKYHSDQKIGVLVTSIRRAQSAVSILIWSIFFQILPVIIELISVTLILTINYKLKYNMILFFTVILFGFYSLLLTNIALKAQEYANTVDEKTENTIIDNLLNYESIKIFWKFSEVISVLKKALIQREQSETESLIKLGLIRLGQVVILGFGLTVLTYHIGQAVVQKELTLGDFILYNGYLLQFITPISILGYLFKDIEKGFLDIKKAFSFLSITPEINAIKNPKKLIGESFYIEFEHVTFSYQGKKILDDVSFVINPGEHIAITGKTGEGKTTLAKLLMRFYDVEKGRILIDGIDIRDIDLESLHSIVSLLPQSISLFNDTIEKNIRFAEKGRDVISLEKIIEAADLSSFINSLPLGYNTIIGERGVKLSGGEKQRILLARLMLRNPKICVLDEPTSFLDFDTAQIIRKNLKKHFLTATVVTITHENAEISEADRVFILKNGKISEPPRGKPRVI